MSENEWQPADEWEAKLAKELDRLKECQNKRGLNSCMKCDELLECEIRKDYVSAVYESMNKGRGGGFEF